MILMQRLPSIERDALFFLTIEFLHTRCGGNKFLFSEFNSIVFLMVGKSITNK